MAQGLGTPSQTWNYFSNFRINRDTFKTELAARSEYHENYITVISSALKSM